MRSPPVAPRAGQGRRTVLVVTRRPITLTPPARAGEGQRWVDDPAVLSAPRSLPLGVHAVGEARHFVARTASAWGIAADHIATATLLTSELVTNAVLYGYGALAVALHCGHGLLRVEVIDGSQGLPQQRPRLGSGETQNEDGLGLLLIEACSREWGVQPHQDGKLVWCDIALAQEPVLTAGR